MSTQRPLAGEHPWGCVLLLGAVALATALVACAPIRAPAVAQPTPAGSTVGLAATTALARLTVVNGTATPICDLFISPTSEANWGEDWLGADETIAPAARRTFRLPPGRYDLSARDCDAEPIAELGSVSVRTSYRWTVTAGEPTATPTATPRTGRATATPTLTPRVRRPTATPSPAAIATPVPQPTPPSLDATLCCGSSPGETGTIWSVRYPAGWSVARLPDNPLEFYGALFADPTGSVVITVIPGANTEPGHPLDTGDVDVWLDRFTRQRRYETPGFTEFWRTSVAGIPGARLWAGTWGIQGDRGWEGYLVVVNPMLLVAPGLPEGYLTLYGLRAGSRDWNNAYTLYTQMVASLRVKRVGGSWQGLPMGEPSQPPYMVRWCATTCDWMAVPATSPDWVGDCYEPTTLWETICRLPAER